MKTKTVINLTILFLFLTPLFSQNQTARAILVYADDETAMEIMDGDGNILEASLGMEIFEGAVIETFGTSAELEMYPSRSIIKLSEGTILSLDNLQQQEESSNKLTLGKGKFRAVIARITGQDQQYNIFTSLTVCGIRGTDFVLDSDGVLVVADGIVDMQNLETRETVTATAGMKIDSRKAIFAAEKITPEELADVYKTVVFEKLVPREVPGKENLLEPAVQTAAPEEKITAEEPEKTETPEPEEPQKEEPPQPVTKADMGASVAVASTSVRNDEDNNTMDPLETLLGQILAMEAGSFTVDNKIYSKLVFQPVILAGKFQAQLYLPFIYDRNLFSSEDWYKPNGNNEWSFGSDQDTTEAFVADAFQDLFLKIRYIKWGDKRDPFSFAFGNYNQVTLGHGILMLNYDNNSEFPAVRKVGLSLSAKGAGYGFEMVGEDFSTPLNQVIGGRGTIPFLGPVSMGISTVVDLDPAKNMDPLINQSYIDEKPVFVNFALDLELPLLTSSIFSLLVYADGASLLPIMDGNPRWDYLADSSQGILPLPKNYGAATGIMGNLLIADYRLEYQYADGAFRHGFYDSTYDKQRGDHVIAISDYLINPDSVESRHGIYGYLGVGIPDIAYFAAGYRWPWTAQGPDLRGDYLQLEVDLEHLPVIGVSGSLRYSRTGLAAALNEGNASFIDTNTVLQGEVIYPVSQSIGLSINIASAFERDSAGSLLFDSSGNPIPTFSMGIGARFQYK
jgi:hypothetical protein